MKNTYVKDSNQSIAIFMGAKLLRTEEAEMPHGSYSEITLEYWKRPDGLPGHDNYADIGHFKYDQYWDWLMPVLEKIRESGHPYTISSKDYPFCLIKLSATENIEVFAETPLRAAWEAVVNFIELTRNEPNA